MFCNGTFQSHFAISRQWHQLFGRPAEDPSADLRGSAAQGSAGNAQGLAGNVGVGVGVGQKADPTAGPRLENALALRNALSTECHQEAVEGPLRGR